MKVLVTGWSGTLGTSLVPKLAAECHLVLVSRRSVVMEKLPNAIFLKCDYSYESIRRAAEGCEAIVHLAAQRNPEQWLTNVALDAKVFQVAQDLGIQNVVFISTRGVYGLDSFHADEQAEVNPIDNYAYGKICSENLALRLNEQGMSIKCLRLAQVMSLTETKSGVMRQFLEAGITGVPITLHKNTSILREYIYVKDVVEAIYLTLINSVQKGIFNLGSGWAYTLKEYAQSIAELGPGHPEILFVDSDHIMERTVMKSDKFGKHFKPFKPHSILEALNDIYYGTGRN